MAAQKSEEKIVFLPWTVEPQPQIQAVILENPQDDKIFVDVAHSTDWVVAWSIVVSGLISLIGFWITIYVVKKSTESQIQSNRELYQSQEKLKLIEIRANHRQDWINKVRDISSEILNLRSKINFILGNQKKYDFQLLITHLYELRFLNHKLDLYLNSSEEISKNILDQVRQIDNLLTKMMNGEIDEEEIEQLTKILFDKTLSQNIELVLKQEWEKVKKGE